MLPSVPKKEMPRIMSAATMASSWVVQVEEEWANSANKFFDAFAAGRPIAINYGGWQAAVLRESGAGVVLDGSDPDEAARELVCRLQDRAWLQRSREAARRLARERYDVDKLATQLEQVLREARVEGPVVVKLGRQKGRVTSSE